MRQFDYTEKWKRLLMPEIVRYLKMEQEQRSLINTGDGFKKIIITKDAVAPLYNDEGVLIMSVYDFLLDSDSMDI